MIAGLAIIVETVILTILADQELIINTKKMELSKFVKINKLEYITLRNKEQCWLCDTEIIECYINKHPDTFFCKKCIRDAAKDLNH